MATKNDILALVRIFAVRKKNQMLPFSEFTVFAQKYAEQKKGDRPTLATLLSDTELQLATYLDELAEEKRCSLVYDQGKISTVVFPDFFNQVIKKRYDDIENDTEMPFPSESALDIELPRDLITSIDVKKDFVRILGDSGDSDTGMYRLNFPEGINSFVVPAQLLNQPLLKLSVQKIRLYLGTQRNAFYMLSKLRSVFKSKEQVLRDTINSVLTQRSQALETIMKPTDFSFGFWTHLANAIIREYREKTNKLEREHSYCQAAYLLGFYNVYFKGIQQKQKDEDSALKTLDRRLRLAPYYFTVSDITEFKDNSGLKLSRKYSPDRMHQYLEEKSKTQEGDTLPEIFRLKVAGRKEYFVCKEVYLPLTVKKIQESSSNFGKPYIEEWKRQIENNRKSAEMKNDDAFSRALDQKLVKESPLLKALLSYELLYLTLQESKPNYDINAEINRILNTQGQKLIPIEDILRLDRKDLLNQAKMSLPFWKTVPVLNRFFSLLKRFLTGAKPAPKVKTKKGSKSQQSENTAPDAGAKLLGSGAPSPRHAASEREGASGKSGKSGVVALQKAMASMKLQFIGNSGLDESIGSLIEKWNPLYDPQAKANLVEDVNSLVRDFLRKLKKGFMTRPPDAARIRNMSEGLAENHAFDQIKKRDALRRYIELYMIKVLGGR